MRMVYFLSNFPILTCLFTSPSPFTITSLTSNLIIIIGFALMFIGQVGTYLCYNPLHRRIRWSSLG